MALCYAMYIVIRCHIQPHLAPSYDINVDSLSEKLALTSKYVVPLGLLVFLTVGVIFLGIATPSEASALGAFGAFALAAVYRKLSWRVIRNSFEQTARITVMVLAIIVGAAVFTQILAFVGITRGLTETVVGLSVSPIFVIIIMQLVVLLMGGMMDPTSVMMVTLPIFMPIVNALQFDPVWFGIMMLINLEMGGTTPPLGLGLFAMLGVAPKDTTMGDVIFAGLPFLLLDALVIVLCMIFPFIVTWLPNMM